MTKLQTFSAEVDFCPGCGALLPSLTARGDVKCVCCAFVVSSQLFDEKVSESSKTLAARLNGPCFVLN